MQERRGINRVKHQVKSVITVCDTLENIYVEVKDVSPLGMGIIAPNDCPDISGKDIIIITRTLIMYADVTRQVLNDDGTYTIGIQAKDFTPDAMQYIFERLG